MIDHSKASTTRNQVDINNNNNNATSSSDLKTSVTKPANNADVSASFKYSIKSLSSSTNKNNRCVVCYKLLHTWKGSRLCRYYDINSEIRGGLGTGKRRQRQASNNNSTPENLSKSCDVQIKAIKPEIVEPAATAAVEVQTVGGRLRSNNKKTSTTAAENNKNGNNASEDGAGAKRNSSKADDSSNADVVNLVNGGSEVNHHGDSNNNNNNNSLVSSLSSSNHKASSNSNFSSNNKFTIGDLISKTLSLKSSAVVQLSGDESKAATLLQAGGKICDCCLDNISLIDYHANHSSQLKAKMMRKFKFASKFHSNRFTLNRNRNRKCLAKRLRGAKRSSSTTNNSFLSTNRRLNGLLNGYNKRVYHLSSESDSSKRTYHRRPQIDHDKIDKLNSLLENVSLAIASAILNNPKAGKLPETRNGLVADDHLNQERQPTMAAKSGGAKSSSSSSASASGVIRNHHQNHNQPRIIESNELINNLNKLGQQQQQQQQQQSSSTNNNNSLSRNRTVTNTSSHPVVKMPETNVLLNLLALVKSHQDAMNNGGAGSGQAGLKFNGLNQNLITNGLQLFNHHQDQFGDQQHQSHSSSSLSPQETNRRKRKSINPSRLPKLGKFDEPFSKLQDQKGGEEENEDDENESEEDNDEDGGHETTADIKPSKESQHGSLMGGQKKTFNNKSTKQQQVLAAGGKNNKAFQKPPATINKSANARKGFSLAKAENGHGGAYNENVLDEADENFNGNEYVADDEDQDQDGGAGDHEDGDEELFNQHDLTSDSHHFENEDEDVENHEGDQNNHDDSAVYQNGGQNNFDDYNDENDDEAELDHQNDNSQEYPEDDEDDENLADGAETMAYDDNNNNFADGGGAGGLLYNEHEHEVNNNGNEEHHLNTEIRKINSKPTSSRPSKTVANAKFSATKQIPAQSNRNAAKPPATAVLQKTNNNNMTGGKKTTNLNSTFKPIASPAAIVGAALKAGGARVQVVNNNQNRVKSEAANNLNNKNGNNRPAAAAVTTVANNNKNKPTIQNAAKNLNNLARNNNQANNLKVAGAKQAAAAAVDVKKPFKSNLNNVNTIAPAKKQPVKTVVQTNHVGTNLRQNRAAIPNKLVAVAKNEMKEEEEEYELDNEDLILNQDLDEENNEMFDENDDQYDGGQVGDDEDPEGEEFFGSQSPSVSPSPSHSSSVIRQNGFNGTGSSQGGNHHERSGSGKNNSAGSSSSNMKHVCQICNKTFKTQNILRQHMRIHTGDKPFVCDLCSKAFSQMASLKYHLATHSDDRPFKCENCSKTFKLKPPFKKHIKECPPRHHGSSNSLYSQSNHNMSGVGVNQDFNDDE